MQPGADTLLTRDGPRPLTLDAPLADSATARRLVVVIRWYRHDKRVAEVATGTAVGYHAGMPAVLLRWVLARDPRGRAPSATVYRSNCSASRRRMAKASLGQLGDG